MSNLLLFIIGGAVSLIFLGGMLIHTVVSQKIKEDEILKGSENANTKNRES